MCCGYKYKDIIKACSAPPFGKFSVTGITAEKGVLLFPPHKIHSHGQFVPCMYFQFAVHEEEGRWKREGLQVNYVVIATK